MKKIKLLTSLMAPTACVVPAISVLSSCSANTQITELASQFKDAIIQTFMDICETTHRSVWNEQEGFDYVVKTMQSYGFTKYTGRDYWSYLPEVRTEITKETGIVWGDPYNPFPNYGNIWYDIPATSGMENAPKVILQAHLDSQMTFANDEAKAKWKESGVNVTFDRDNDILSTDGQTSLGADGGMGMALLLTIARYRNKFNHGGIRLLFTAGESEATNGEFKYTAGAHFLWNDQENAGYEKGKTDYSYLSAGALKPFGNNDNEFSQVISISGLYNKTIYRSVGGISEVCFSDKALNLSKDSGSVSDSKDLNHIYDKLPKDTGGTTNFYTITIDNLHGGKSSKDINSGYANALQMLMKTLNIDKPIQLISASSQPGAYNIAKTATCTIASSATLAELNASKDSILTAFKQSCPAENWSEVKFEINQITDTTYNYGLSINQTKAFVKMFAEDLQFGATDWFDEGKTNVRTSYNHGKLNLLVSQDPSPSSAIEFYAILRSNISSVVEEWEKTAKSHFVNGLGKLYDATSEVESHVSRILNPAWDGTDPNALIDLISKGYKNFGITPKIVDNHGWTEVGCLPDAFEKISPHMNMACLGVEINNSQELSESVYTDSLNTLLKSLIYALMNIKEVA